MFRPLGSFAPTAVLTDIGLFFDNDQLHKFSLASPKAKGLFKSRRMMAYKNIEIRAPGKNKISIEWQDTKRRKRKIHIDTDKEDLTEKIAIFLSMTLSLISDCRVLPMPGADRVVDVNDEFLEGNHTEFDISGFLTKFTINGISAFVQKDGFRTTAFGILASDQMQDAIDFEIAHPHDANDFSLMSNDGQKKLYFRVVLGIKFNVLDRCVSFYIDLNTTDTDQSGMVPIPNNLYGIVAQESFLKFNKIFSNPEELLPISQYQLDYLSIGYADCVFNIHYTIRGEDREIDIEKTDVNLKDAHKITVEILRNCTSINRLYISGIKLDEDFYHLLKPIADNIHVPKWSIESALEPESLREVQAATSGLFTKINLTKMIFDEDEDETDEDEDEVEDEDVDEVEDMDIDEVEDMDIDDVLLR